MRDITPKHLKCGIVQCPAVFDVTPEHLKCEIVASCSSVSKIGDGREFLIIGKTLRADDPLMEEVGDRIGIGETAIRISAEYFAELDKRDDF